MSAQLTVLGDVSRATARLLSSHAGWLLSLANQAVVAGTNFIVALYLMRVLSTADFGIYAVCYSAVMLIYSVANALFIGQFVVHLPDYAGEERRNYAANIGAAILALGLTIAAGGIAASMLAWHALAKAAGDIAATGCLAGAYLLREFACRYAFATWRTHHAVLANVVTAVGTGMALGALAGTALTRAHALWALAAAHLAGAIVGLLLARLPWQRVAACRVAAAVREVFVGGRWALLGVGAAWAQMQGHLYVSILLLGPAATGMINGARTFVSPLSVVVLAAYQAAFPRMTEARCGGATAVQAIAHRLALVLLVTCAIYGLAVLTPLTTILSQVVPAQYTSDKWLIIAWLLVACAAAPRQAYGGAMIALKQFRLLAWIGIAAAVATMLVTIGLTAVWGTLGAVTALALGELILLTAIVRIGLGRASDAAGRRVSREDADE